MPKASGEKTGVLERGHWSRFAGTGWKTGTYGRFQPVLKAGFPVVLYRDVFVQFHLFRFVVPACFCSCLDHLKLMTVYAFYFPPFPNLFAPWLDAP